MLIDDAKGSLTAPKAANKDEQQVKARSDLNVGDIVYQCMDRNDGLTLKGDYNTRYKYFVIVGKKSNGDAIGLCLINSNLDFYKNNPNRQRFQYILKQANYPSILKKDSRLDCTDLVEMKVRKSVAVKAEVVGHLTDDDEAVVLPLVASSDYIGEHQKKIYHIRQKK